MPSVYGAGRTGLRGAGAGQQQTAEQGEYVQTGESLEHGVFSSHGGHEATGSGQT